jgi:hypothetical protein
MREESEGALFWRRKREITRIKGETKEQRRERRENNWKRDLTERKGKGRGDVVS